MRCIHRINSPRGDMGLSSVLEILYEDNHLLALNKPAGWPTTHYDGVEETFDRVVKTYLKEKYNKPGNVFLGVVHRLDKPTSGCLIFAKTSKAAARLSEQFRENAVEKVYWAVLEKTLDAKWQWPDAGSLDDWLWHNDAEHKVLVVPANTPEAKPARLLYTVKARYQNLVLLELRPHTGRKHQLRVQLASRGWPIYADRKYGSQHAFGPAIGLHARQISFLHPTKTEFITLDAPLPQAWRGRFAYLLKELLR